MLKLHAAHRATFTKLAPMTDETRATLIKMAPDATDKTHLAGIFQAFTSAMGHYLPDLKTVTDISKVEKKAGECDYVYNGGTWTGTLEHGFARRRGGINFITMRLANDGFIYHDAIVEEIRSRITGPPRLRGLGDAQSSRSTCPDASV